MTPLAGSTLASATHPPQLTFEDKIAGARPLLFGSLAACLLLSVAWYNGYPIIFSDTGSYLWTGAFFKPLAPFRAPGYSLFTRFMSLGASAWFVVATQAVAVVYVLVEICNYLMEGNSKHRDRFLLASVCVLTLLTSLPWLVSELMPDVFAGVLFLCAFLLAFDGEVTLLRRMCLAAVLLISGATHASLLPIAIVLVAFILAWRIVDPQWRTAPSMTSVLAWLLVPILAAGFCTAALNLKMGKGFRISAAGSSFLLARLFGDGLATDFLNESCAKRNFISCTYLSNPPRTAADFMFHHPLIQVLWGHEDEMNEIVRGTLLAYPLRFTANSVKSTFFELAAVRTGEEVRSYTETEWSNSVIPYVFPGDSEALLRSKQRNGRLLSLANAAATVHTIVFWLSTAACLYFAWTRPFERVNRFFRAAVAFLVINASICATFSGLQDRYQSRVAWMMLFCLASYLYLAAKESRLFAKAPKSADT